ncbi:PhzF family phenazine biosynthesis protein [Romboutsia sp. Marseille-P6047]|uniref:PhzF family phenazine biosynthesis protein n=1 Tax=Romboutsia sp. Marseille-P6047 TaxID=2161817 RepID=UPI000F05F9A8|nr:PhzF family phenazine biosynthesis protein [Romboutsia sp. Marseille-P6047]
MKYYIVDAFTEKTFGGNPAGVCILDNSIEHSIMQKIASENNLSETAFVTKNKNCEDCYDLKWFTPKAEIDLCGHATLASAFVIFNYIDKNIDKIKFSTLSGVLEVTKDKESYTMNFPNRMPKKVNISNDIIEAIGKAPLEAYLSRDLILIYNKEDDIKSLNPDFSKLELLTDGIGIVVTSIGKNEDFISRCFFPKLEVNEDLVTGSSHSSLIPLWSAKLKKNKMITKQLSDREGILVCEVDGDRVKISGKARLYLKGEIYI